MRILERMDAGLVAIESVKFWQNAGYNRIQVLVNAGMVTVTIRGGRLAPPTKAQRSAWNRQKYNGICYHVKRTGILGITIWSSKNWDVD